MIKPFAAILVLFFGSSDLWAQLKVDIINVGQGDAIYLEFPSGKNALIDGGPSAAPIMAFFKQKGITKLDNVVLTHPHDDHYTGLNWVFNQLEVKNFYDTKMDNTEAAGDNEMRVRAASEPDCAIHYPAPGEYLKWDSQISVRVLNSCPEPVKSRLNSDINDCSIVLQIRYNGSSILLMGDAETSKEDEIIGRFGRNIKSGILKVSHHGARYATSEKFLSAVQPKYAYISVGLNNVFGHPHKEALDRLKGIGAKIFMTSLSGTQSFTIPAKKDLSSPEPVSPSFGQEMAGSAVMTVEPKYIDMPLLETQPATIGPASPAMLQLVDYTFPEEAVR
jgi:competence protein ComEC